MDKCRVQLFYVFDYQQNIQDKMTWNNGSCALFAIYLSVYVCGVCDIYVIYVCKLIYRGLGDNIDVDLKS